MADAGNDRVLIFNHIPTTNGASADAVLGQPNMFVDVVTSATISIISTVIDNTGSVDTIANPSSLAWDGTNLYVSDPFDERVLVYTPADIQLAEQSTLNAASQSIRQEGFVVLQLPGSITSKDTVTITIQSATYTYTVQSSDTLDTITNALIKLINNANSGAGDPNVIALGGSVADTIYLDLQGDQSRRRYRYARSYYVRYSEYHGYRFRRLSDWRDQCHSRAGNADSDQQSCGCGCPIPIGLHRQRECVLRTRSAVHVGWRAGISRWIPFADPFGKSNGSHFPDSFQLHGEEQQQRVCPDCSPGWHVTVTTASPVYLTPANPGLFATPNVPEPRPGLQRHALGNESIGYGLD